MPRRAIFNNDFTMKTSELMIGDWVFNAYHGENIQITPYDFFTHGHFEDGQYIPTGVTPSNGWDLEPIPLTPEILEKNGFEEFDGWRILDMDDVEIRWIGTILEISGSRGNMELPNVQCVHELQNALRLCGIDKEIIL